MNKLLIIMLLVIIAPVYAIELHNAVILEHSSSITGSDDDGYAVDGHIESTERTDKVKNKPVEERL